MSEDQLQPLQAALEDHSAEGIAILTAEPSRLIQATLLVIAGLLVAALAWAFIGRADVMVTVSGALEPEGEVRRVYAPVEGELVDLYVAEGTPVTAGDVMARLNARRAVEVAANALDAEIALSEAEFRVEQFPQTKLLKLDESESLQRQIEIERAAHERRLAEGMSRLTEANKARLEEARTSLEQANRQRDLALSDYQKYQRLFNSAGGGGVARKEVEDRRAAYDASEAEARVAEAKLSELELELSRAYTSARTELETSDQKLNALKLERARLLKDLEQEERRIDAELQSARLRAQATRRVSFANIDDENFLRVLAPVSGIVTDLAVTQPGQQVGANAPLGSIAPSDARPLLVVEVPERDRGFLREGQPAKLKFNAFPYQRYGQIEGIVEYLAPAAQLSPQSKEPVYEARISLERDQFEVDDQVYPLRYGMIATAEIVVRERRLIDLALDPLRNL
ncbi:HlyD family efflux transporter periplasmic adaptor subunit [Thiorhodococcus mannitoliphagus]|uniref:HlyD family efflux transporter periplasmic adaptor subunit n=1 Tax=Thiorhodococcus mannitoliphagus TaxID=329406 RepID=A0A6P1E171_9GAMM|nr:HlyD family efflux transporter periplasmic adaptor subunit [Thiorhodococcus mannitoliphagus]NEX21734.1 HlyD family efflux transporter periplasmic adaptor subunit [Thiorhodococcus mannitoliphagus]